MLTRRKRKADGGGIADENVDRGNKKAGEEAAEEVGSRRPKRAASKGILSAIEAAQGPRRAARKNAGGNDACEVATEPGKGAQKGTKKKQVQQGKKADRKEEASCVTRPAERDAGKRGGKGAKREAKEGVAEKGMHKSGRRKALKPEDIVKMLGDDAEEDEAGDGTTENAPPSSPLKKIKDNKPKPTKISRKNPVAKRGNKKLKPDEIRGMLDCGENNSEEEEEDVPAGKPSMKSGRTADVSKRSANSTTDNKVPVYRMGTTKTQDDKKPGDADVYDAFNPIYDEEFGPEDKKTKARRAAKARRLAKKKEEAKIILTFGAAARENVVPAIKTLKNLKTPMQQKRRPLKAMNQMRLLAPAIVLEKSSSQNPLPATTSSQAEGSLNVPKVPKVKVPKRPITAAPLPPADFSDMASCGADAYFPSYVENETGSLFDAACSSQAGREVLSKLPTPALPEQHKNYKTPAVPRHIGRRIDGKVSTPREQPFNAEDRDTKLSTKELVKKCFGFDSDDTGSEMDNDSLTDISPVRGVMEPPRGNMSMSSMSRLSTLSIPDKASSTFLTGKSSAHEVCVGPYRANLPTKVLPRPISAFRKRPPAKLPCNVPSKMGSTAQPNMPPPKVINAKARVKALDSRSKKALMTNMSEPRSHNSDQNAEKNTCSIKSLPDPSPGCSKWPDNYATAVDDLNRAATTEGAEGPTGTLVVDNHDIGEIEGSNAIGEAEATNADDEDDNEYEDMDEDDERGDPGKENRVKKAISLEGGKQKAKKSKKSRNASRQPLISEMLSKKTSAMKGKRPAMDESTDDDTMAIPHQKRKKAYCKRTLNTSIGSSPVKVNKRTEKRVNEWAHLQTSHFSGVDEFDLTFA